MRICCISEKWYGCVCVCGGGGYWLLPFNSHPVIISIAHHLMDTGGLSWSQSQLRSGDERWGYSLNGSPADQWDNTQRQTNIHTHIHNLDSWVQCPLQTAYVWIIARHHWVLLKQACISPSCCLCDGRRVQRFVFVPPSTIYAKLLIVSVTLCNQLLHNIKSK